MVAGVDTWIIDGGGLAAIWRASFLDAVGVLGVMCHVCPVGFPSSRARLQAGVVLCTRTRSTSYFYSYFISQTVQSV